MSRHTIKKEKMERVKYISNVLPEKLILEIKNYAIQNSKKAVWNTNKLLWAEPIVKDSGSVDILNLKQLKVDYHKQNIKTKSKSIIEKIKLLKKNG